MNTNNKADHSFAKYFPSTRKAARKFRGVTAPKPPKAKTATTLIAQAAK
jgi:hypothetical protein